MTDVVVVIFVVIVTVALEDDLVTPLSVLVCKGNDKKNLKIISSAHSISVQKNCKLHYFKINL